MTYKIITWDFAGTDIEDMPGLRDADGRILLNATFARVARERIEAEAIGAEELIAELDAAASHADERGAFALPESWSAARLTGEAGAYLAAFPHYLNGAAFQAIGAALADLGFTDSSWGNDENPKLAVYPHDEAELCVYVEDRDPELREYCPVAVTFFDHESDTDELDEGLDTFDPAEVRAAVLRRIASLGPAMDLFNRASCATLTASLEKFARMNFLRLASADEMIHEIPEDHPHRAELAGWLVDFCEAWEEVQEAEDAAETELYEAWRGQCERRAPSEEDREIYPEAEEIIEHPDGGRIGVRSAQGAPVYDVLAGRFDGTFDDLEEARAALWREHSQHEFPASRKT